MAAPNSVRRATTAPRAFSATASMSLAICPLPLFASQSSSIFTISDISQSVGWVERRETHHSAGMIDKRKESAPLGRERHRKAGGWIGRRPQISTFRAAVSLHGRDHEFCAFLGAGGPARRDRLGLGVEVDRVGAVLVEVAEAGTLPAAERVIGERHGNGEIDADHADLHAVDEIARGVAVAREDGHAVAVFMI